MPIGLEAILKSKVPITGLIKTNYLRVKINQGVVKSRLGGSVM
jgi:hypothetical protein